MIDTLVSLGYKTFFGGIGFVVVAVGGFLLLVLLLGAVSTFASHKKEVKELLEGAILMGGLLFLWYLSANWDVHWVVLGIGFLLFFGYAFRDEIKTAFRRTKTHL